MSWVAKNSLTGHVYGSTFNDIYSCQSYIDKELIILEYLYRRIKFLEDSIDDDVKFDAYVKEHYPYGLSVAQEIFARIEFSLKPFIDDIQNSISRTFFEKEEKKDEVLDNVCGNYFGNNIIRCWYVEQERFATGFDF